MSTEQNKILVRRYFEQVVNRVDRAAADELVAPNLVFNSPYTPQPTQDRESFLQMLTAVHAAFPDFNLVDHDLIAEGDQIASRWTVYGTHDGELAGMPPSRKKVAITGLSIYRIANGKIVEGWVQDDTIQQLTAASQATRTTA